MFIYKITNTKTGKVYIGSAKDFKVRWEQHKRMLDKGEHHSPKLQNSYSYHGEQCFEYEVLEDLSGKVSREELYKVEDSYIKDYDSVSKGYNCKGVGEDLKYTTNKKIVKDITNNRELLKEYMERLKRFLSNSYGKDLKLPVLINSFNIVSDTTPIKRLLLSIDVLLCAVDDLSSNSSYEDYLKISHVNYLNGSYDYKISKGVKKLSNGLPANWKWISIETKLHYRDQLISQWVDELLSCSNGKILFNIIQENGINLTLWLPENLNLLKEAYLTKYLLETRQEFVEITGFCDIDEKLLKDKIIPVCNVSGKVRYDRSGGFF